MRSIVNVGLPIYYGNNDTSVCSDIENTPKAIDFPRIKWNIVCHNLRDGKRTEAPLRDLPHYFGQVGELHARLERCEFQLIIKVIKVIPIPRIQQNKQDVLLLDEHRTRLNESQVDPLQISIVIFAKYRKSGR